jgi:putative transposase
MLNFKGARFPIVVILVCIRWYAAYPLSYRHLDEMMEERGVLVDYSSINWWGHSFPATHREDGSETQAPGRRQLEHG